MFDELGMVKVYDKCPECGNNVKLIPLKNPSRVLTLCRICEWKDIQETSEDNVQLATTGTVSITFGP